MSRPIPLAVACLLFTSSLFAQLTTESFEHKRTSDLYDERGFMQNKAITVDGKLIVSNSNGNVSYSYPLSSWQNGGFGFNVELNYCGSVAHSSFGEYEYGSITHPHTGWQRFQQNRPAWLIGVNGFAVQALSVSLS